MLAEAGVDTADLIDAATDPQGVNNSGHRGHLSSEQAALKCLYLVTRSLDPTGHGRARWAMRWKPELNAFSITFGDRFPAAEAY